MIKFFSTVFLVLIPSFVALGEPPNGDLEITYRQLDEGGTPSESYHQLLLSCYDGDCSIETITFNQCFGGVNDQRSSFIKAESASTKEGSLKVVSSTATNIALSETRGGATLTYRFTFSTVSDPFKKTLFNTRHDVWFDQILDFSGGATKSSDLLNQVITWRLVPVRSASKRRYEDVQATCAITVAALPSK